MVEVDPASLNDLKYFLKWSPKKGPGWAGRAEAWPFPARKRVFSHLFGPKTTQSIKFPANAARFRNSLASQSLPAVSSASRSQTMPEFLTFIFSNFAELPASQTTIAR
jgi:hypothetical protein